MKSKLNKNIADLAHQSGGWTAFKEHFLTVTAVPLGINTASEIEAFKKRTTEKRYGFSFTYDDIRQAEQEELERARLAKRRSRFIKPTPTA